LKGDKNKMNILKKLRNPDYKEVADALRELNGSHLFYPYEFDIKLGIYVENNSEYKPTNLEGLLSPSEFFVVPIIPKNGQITDKNSLNNLGKHIQKKLSIKTRYLPSIMSYSENGELRIPLPELEIKTRGELIKHYSLFVAPAVDTLKDLEYCPWDTGGKFHTLKPTLRYVSSPKRKDTHNYGRK
jgi:hypothetical protein